MYFLTFLKAVSTATMLLHEYKSAYSELKNHLESLGSHQLTKDQRLNDHTPPSFSY